MRYFFHPHQRRLDQPLLPLSARYGELGQISADPELPEYIGGTARSDSKVTKQLI
jgi:hypothetical protein